MRIKLIVMTLLVVLAGCSTLSTKAKLDKDKAMFEKIVAFHLRKFPNKQFRHPSLHEMHLHPTRRVLTVRFPEEMKEYYFHDYSVSYLNQELDSDNELRKIIADDLLLLKYPIVSKRRGAARVSQKLTEAEIEQRKQNFDSLRQRLKAEQDSDPFATDANREQKKKVAQNQCSRCILYSPDVIDEDSKQKKRIEPRCKCEIVKDPVAAIKKVLPDNWLVGEIIDNVQVNSKGKKTGTAIYFVKTKHYGPKRKPDPALYIMPPDCKDPVYEIGKQSSPLVLVAEPSNARIYLLGEIPFIPKILRALIRETETLPVIKKSKPEEMLAVRTEVGNAILDAVIKSLAEMHSDTKAKPCQTQGEAQLLIKSNFHIIRSPQSCPFAEHKGYFLFAGLTTEKPDDGSFESGYAVKKGSTNIYFWERK